MKIKATIQATIEVKDDCDPDQAHDEVIQALAHICEGWIEGTMAPKIKIQYVLDEIYQEEIKDKYIN